MSTQIFSIQHFTSNTIDNSSKEQQYTLIVSQLVVCHNTLSITNNNYVTTGVLLQTIIMSQLVVNHKQ